MDGHNADKSDGENTGEHATEEQPASSVHRSSARRHVVAAWNVSEGEPKCVGASHRHG